MFSIIICRAEKIIVERCFIKQILSVVFNTFIKQNFVHDFKSIFKRSSAFPITYLFSCRVWNQFCILSLVPFFSIKKIAERQIVVIEIIAFPDKKQLLMCTILSPIMRPHGWSKVRESLKNTLFNNTIFAYSVIKFSLILINVSHNITNVLMLFINSHVIMQLRQSFYPRGSHFKYLSEE